MGGGKGPPPPRPRHYFWPNQPAEAWAIPARPSDWPEDMPPPARMSLALSSWLLLLTAVAFVLLLTLGWTLAWIVFLVAGSVTLVLGISALTVSTRRPDDTNLRRYGLTAVGFVVVAVVAVVLTRIL